MTAGRRNEFRHFKAFSDPESRQTIPDPQAISTFQNCKLNWNECRQEPHVGTLRLYQELLKIRKTQTTRQEKETSFFEVNALDKNILALKREPSNHSALLIVSCLQNSGRAELKTLPITRPPGGCQWQLLLTTEDNTFTASSDAPQITTQNGNIILDFQGPCTTVFRTIKPDQTPIHTDDT